MKLFYISIAAFLIGGMLAGCSSQPSVNETEVQEAPDTSKANADSLANNTFEELRNKALSIRPEQMGDTIQSDEINVYGVVMDWGMGGETATIAAYQTGSASLYMSAGSGGVIGGVRHKRVVEAAKKMISSAQGRVGDALITKDTPLPKVDKVRFYFLTNKGVYVGEEDVKNFDKNNSIWKTLFEEGNMVLAELRQIANKS